MKNIHIFLISIFTILFINGCSTGNNKVVHKESKLPSWYLNPPIDDEFLYGIGAADGPDLGMTRTAAEAAARDDIVRQVAIKVENMIKSSKQQVGQGSDSDVINMQQSASNQIASQMLRECKVIEREIDTHGGSQKVYALVRMSLESLKAEAKKSLMDKDMQKQLEIGNELQDVLAKEIDRIDGERE